MEWSVINIDYYFFLKHLQNTRTKKQTCQHHNLCETVEIQDSKLNESDVHTFHILTTRQSHHQQVQTKVCFFKKDYL